MKTTLMLSSGITHSISPFKPGDVSFELSRGNAKLIQATGDPILARIIKYNYSVTSGSATTKGVGDL